jgi:hypothetical protein
MRNVILSVFGSLNFSISGSKAACRLKNPAITLFSPAGIIKKLLLFGVLNLIASATVLADYTISQNTTIDAKTLIGQSGVLTINGTLNLTQDVILSGFTSVIISGNGQIYWSKNYSLTFQEGTSIIINSPALGLQPTSGNGNGAQRLIIGSTIIGVSSDNASVGEFSFQEFNSLGGLPQYNLLSNSPVCDGNAISMTIAPVRSVSTVNYSYQWSISPVSGSFTYNKTNTSVSIAPVPGNYTVTCVATANSFSTTKTIQISVTAAGKWLGKNNNWNDASNWSCGIIPTTKTNVVIPVSINQPQIVSSVASVNNISIDKNAFLTVNGTLQIAGTINNNGTFDATAGTIEFIGSATQTISGSWFLNKTINNLKISNANGLNLFATANDTLNLTGLLSFNVSNATFNTNDNLTLKSTAIATAAVSDLTNNGILKGNTIRGNVIVERYINIGSLSGQHNKAWVMVSTPTQGQSIKETWMESGNKTSTGYGTQITGNGIGFDSYSATPSLKYFDDASNNWVGITNTNLPVLNSLGYMLFVRGDRSVAFPNFNNTTLRTKGTLIMGTTTPINVKAGKFQSVGNPYAAEVDIRKIHSSGIVTDVIIWDPTLTIGSLFGLGAYQTLYKVGENYVNLFPSPSYGPAGSINNNIKSGLAFFVQSFQSDGQIYFTEDAKAQQAGKGIAMRQQTTSNDPVSLQASLYGVAADGSSFITDCAVQQFSDDFSNGIDANDTRKIGNSSENLSILSHGNSLVIERRNLPVQTDTIFYNLAGVVNQNYRFIFNASGLENADVNGFIEDTYTKTRTVLNMDGNTQVDFTVNAVAASKAASRFRIVFQEMRVMPVTFTSVKATQKNTAIAVEWKVENQSKLKQYEVEKSVDGSGFSKVVTIAVDNSSASVYNWLDQNVVDGYNYYRIRSVDMDGKTQYTSIVKVQIAKTSAQIKVYPNPATDAKVSLEFTNSPAGVYYARLLNPLGQTIVSQKIIHQEGSSTETIKWNNATARGIYQLEITKPDAQVETIKVVY